MNFNIGEKVSFDSGDGKRVAGTIFKLNKKTISLMSPDGVQWNVHPALLRREAPERQTSIPGKDNVIPLRIS